MSELFYCKACKDYHEALTEEVSSYQCPKCAKAKPKLKILDHVRKEYLTKVNGSDETVSPKPKNFSSDDVKKESNEP